MKTARDGRGEALQFSSFETADYQNVTTAVQFSTEAQTFVDVTPMTDDAWIKVASSAPTAATGEGKLIPFGGFRSVRIPKAYYIASDAEINVVPYGN
jgi:hypothetical protein